MMQAWKYAAGFALAASTATAGGLDRSNQSTSFLFNEPGTFDFSFGHVKPSITGRDALGNSYDIGRSYTQTALSYTGEINESLSFGLHFDQPFGVDVSYNNSPLTSTLGGTSADLSSKAISALVKYQISDRFSVFGGLRAQSIEATVSLNGVAYANAISVQRVATATGFSTAVIQGVLASDPTAIATVGGAVAAANIGTTFATTRAAFNAAGGYNVSFGEDYGVGYTLGMAYEIPDIALRAVLSYHSAIDHNAATTENIFGVSASSTSTYSSPQSVNLDFQTGIAQDTLLTASVRWAEWGAVDIIPQALGSDLVNLDNSVRYNLGVARRFNEKFSGSISMSYEAAGDGSPVSPLGPTDGQFGVTIGGRYTNGNTKISGGINYTWLGDADAGVADSAVASFTNNSAIGIGFKVETVF